MEPNNINNFNDDIYYSKEQHPLLLRYTPVHKIRVSLVLRDIGNNCIPCDILLVTGNRTRRSPFKAIKDMLEERNPNVNLRISHYEAQEGFLFHLDWPKAQVPSLDPESNKNSDLWKQLYWFRQTDDNEILETAYYKLTNAIKQIDSQLSAPSNICIPLIGTKLITDRTQRFEKMASLLHELDHGPGLKRIKSILIYTDNTQTLDCINRLMLDQGFCPSYDLLCEGSSSLIKKLSQIHIEHTVLRKCQLLIIFNIDDTYENSKRYYQKGQNYRGATVTAASIQLIGLNIRLSVEELARLILKNHISPEEYRQLKEKNLPISTLIKIAKKKTLRPDLNQAIKDTLKQFWTLVNSLRIKGNLLQHSGSLWFIGEVDPYEYVQEYIELLTLVTGPVSSICFSGKNK